MSEVNDVAETDPLMSLWADVQQQRARIGRIQEPTPKKALTELSDTGLSVMEDLLSYLVTFRNYVSESLEDVDARLGVLEEDSSGSPPLLSPDEAGMLLQLAAACEAFTIVIRDSSVSINAEAKQKLDETLDLVKRVRAWVAENVDDGEDDEEDVDDAVEDGAEEASIAS